jgi:hypothetical protein
MVLVPPQSSNPASRLAIIDPLATLPSIELTLVWCVWPEIKFRWPITVVRNSVSKKLSLMAKVLRVVPNGRYGVAVVVAHIGPSWAARPVGTLRTLVQQAAMSVLLVGIVVVVVAEYLLAAPDPERFCGVRIEGDQRSRQAVDRGVFGKGANWGSPGGLAAFG